MAHDQDTARILIVDSNAVAAIELESRLKSLGYRVCGVVATESEAIEFARLHKPDLIIMDLIPDNGNEVIKAAAFIRNELGIPLVFQISADGAGLLERIRQAVPLGCLVKPVKDLDLGITMRTALYTAVLETKQRKTEQALRSSEERFNGVLSSLHQTLVIFFDRQGHHLFAWGDQELENKYGIKSSDIVGTSLRDVMPPEEADEKIAELRHIFETGEARRGEYLVHMPTGDFWNDITLSPVFNSSGRVDMVVGFIRDITDRKLAEETLFHSEAKMRGIFSVAPIGIGLESNGLFIEVNDQFCEITGYSRYELIGNETKMVYPSEADCVHARREIYRQVEETDIGAVETRFQRRDGKIINVLMRSSPLNHEDPSAGVIFTALDITERKLAEDMLRESQERTRATLDAVCDAVFIHPLMEEGFASFVDVNDTACARYGYTREEFLKLKAPDITVKVDANAHSRREHRRKLSDCGKLIFETRHITKSGNEFPVEINSVVIELGGRPTILAVVRDITERKQAEGDRIKLEAQLRQAQKMEAIGTLAGGVAHDFNNLLQAIQGYTQLMIMDKSESDPEYPMLKAVKKSGDRAAALIRQLLLFSRKTETERRLLDLNEEIEHAFRLLERTIPKMVDMEIRLDKRLWTVSADPVQIEQILLNLGGNAADAMPDGGRLVIEADNVSVDGNNQHKHLGAKPGNYVFLTISDTGHGIEKEAIEKIFDPFYTTKEIGKGTGLGLASVYGIVKGHGGHITCLSEVGQGTFFKIYLPAVKEIDTEHDNGSDALDYQRGTETILLVDDEQAIMDFASRALRQFGYSVLTAASGEEALEICSTGIGQIDLIILDLGMPGMGGLNCLHRIVQLNSEAKVLIASGYSSDGRIEEALKAGAAGYVGKPYQLSELLGKVRTVFDQGD